MGKIRKARDSVFCPSTGPDRVGYEVENDRAAGPCGLLSITYTSRPLGSREQPFACPEPGGIRHLLEARLLPSCRIDRRVQIRRIDIDRLMERHTS